jgi:integrase
MMSIKEAMSRIEAERDYPRMRQYIWNTYPRVAEALRYIDESRVKGRGKGYSLVKRENKKSGYVYYVRYPYGGRMLPSKWNTHTNVLREAERFAEENRERLIGAYLGAHDGRGLAILEGFYEEGSAHLLCEEKRSGPVSGQMRKRCGGVIKNKFMPFLKGRGIRSAEKIDARVLSDFQDELLGEGLKPQSVNDNLKGVKKVFAYLERKGIVKENPCRTLKGVRVRRSDQNVRGCYELEALKGVFDEPWEERLLYVLCLTAYTTGMRNSEIQGITPGAIREIGGVHFIDIQKSKTENGVRLAPLHERVFKALEGCWAAGGFAAGGWDRKFKAANLELGRRLGADEAELKAQGITFYSGRHFWKTMMNAGGLGEDAEELFMGHKVTSDVKKRYNHKDKQGQEEMVKKAKKVFSILDRYVFS